MGQASPEWQLQCYGCLEADLKASIERSLTFKLTGAGMVAMSILSDSQEMIEHGSREDARQAVNRAKWVISNYLMKDLRERAEASDAQDTPPQDPPVVR